MVQPRPNRLPLAALTVVGALVNSPAGTAELPGSSAPTLAEIGAATVRGLSLVTRPITLHDGSWPAERAAGSGEFRAGLVRGFRLTGDLDGDGNDDAVVLVWESGGGSGTLSSVAIFAGRDGRVANTGTASLGDRVQVRAGRIENHRLVLETVQAGKSDALCCPGDLVTRTWIMDPAGLRELPQLATGRLSPALLNGSVWRLHAWNIDEPAPAEPAISLQGADGRIAGRSGCNSYSAAPRAGPAPGDIVIGPVTGTRMACPEPEMLGERRYLDQLSNVTKFGFLAGQLALTYVVDGEVGVMLFDRSPPAQPVL